MTPEWAGGHLPIPGSFAGGWQDVGLGSTHWPACRTCGTRAGWVRPDGTRPGEPHSNGLDKRERPDPSAVWCSRHVHSTTWIVAWLSLCVSPSRRLTGQAGGGAAHDTWPRPRAASGRRGVGKEGPPGDSQQRLQEAGRAALASQPPPRHATLNTHLRGWHDGGTGGGGGNQRGLRPTVPSPLPSLSTPLHSGKRSPPPRFFLA